MADFINAVCNATLKCLVFINVISIFLALPCVHYRLATLSDAQQLSNLCICFILDAFWIFAVIEMAETSEKKWSHERKKLLLEVRLRHEPDFCAKKKKRSAIWEQIMREIKEVEGTFPFSRDEATRCFINLMGTYKRIKKRNNTSGESSTNWEFFDVMDEVFGSRSSVQVPSEMLECSLQSLVEDLTSDSPLTPTDSHAPMNLDATPSGNITQRFAIKRKRCEVLEFLSKESEADAKVMKKLLDIEAEKIAVEKEEVAELKEIRALFQRIVDRSQ